jgi:tetratricopeptide (TPR) repeat protein
MAESWSRAFGRYLRTLRQRRGLSLQEVCSLSQAFAENLEKGYLSRCENGHQGLAFSKIIPLSRIYDVPADVLLERLELDKELDHVGSPPTDGMTFAELTKSAAIALDKGFCWKGYGLLRDAISKASTDPVKSSFGNREEQMACAYMNCATAGRRLGRRRFALYEYTKVERSGALGQRLRVILLERLSQSYRSLRQMDRALEYGDLAIGEAECSGESSDLALAYSNRAQLAFAESDLDTAARLFQKAHDAFRRAGDNHARARSMTNLAQVYFDLGRLRAAKRAVVVAEKLATRFEQPRARALSRILMGEIDLAEDKDDLAVRRWREAAAIAKQLDDKELRFKAEYFLFKQAQQSGNRPVARSLGRRLRKLAQWVPEDTPELSDFRHLQQRFTSTRLN